jgi:hypothetical protein
MAGALLMVIGLLALLGIGAAFTMKTSREILLDLASKLMNKTVAYCSSEVGLALGREEFFKSSSRIHSGLNLTVHRRKML